MHRILTIEDEEDIRQDICDLLELEGFEVIGAANGLTGLQSIYKNAPDLVICDILMPELDGYGVLKKVRQEFDRNAIPFVFLSAKTSAENKQIAFELGANAYLTKPFTTGDLLKTVREILD